MIGPDDLREPVSQYSDALRWLWTHSAIEDWLWSSADPDEVDLPPEAALVCDMFWIDRRSLVRRLRKDWTAALMPPLGPVRRRRHVWGC